MPNIVSADGTKIAYDRAGSGDPLILVLGAFNDRSTHTAFAAALSSNFTVYNYDRRGRGASTDTKPYAVEREIEDLEALIDDAGKAAFVVGYSSGAVLALRAAAAGVHIAKLALYEPPAGHPNPPTDTPEQLQRLIDAGARGDAVELFQTRVIGMPTELVAQTRHAPFRPSLEAMAHTLVYDTTLTRAATDAAGLADGVKIPTLVLVGDNSPIWMQAGGRAIAAAVPDVGEYRQLTGQNHDIVPAVVVPELVDFHTATGD
ncbi:alpha/beta fold hydrolase [Actinocrispum wychmicini]|uniref:Pimeloyl-ACP methyl ester carboxylesterase n=1 Tax=Actinocrispum wychmicini TaxID=1213861 RepID=A0A4R2JFR5_9PSEU|nr:alpha/beta hydrolase [Actinocrispum wychmicini]TCO55139.1 pimeloyl-ACP methyl ester carboxylesterase [Actinocrispum wychmicini]